MNDSKTNQTIENQMGKIINNDIKFLFERIINAYKRMFWLEIILLNLVVFFIIFIVCLLLLIIFKNNEFGFNIFWLITIFVIGFFQLSVIIFITKSKEGSQKIEINDTLNFISNNFQKYLEITWHMFLKCLFPLLLLIGGFIILIGYIISQNLLFLILGLLSIIIGYIWFIIVLYKIMFGYYIGLGTDINAKESVEKSILLVDKMPLRIILNIMWGVFVNHIMIFILTSILIDLILGGIFGLNIFLTALSKSLIFVVSGSWMFLYYYLSYNYFKKIEIDGGQDYESGSAMLLLILTIAIFIITIIVVALLTPNSDVFNNNNNNEENIIE